MNIYQQKNQDKGYALVVVLMLVLVMGIILATYHQISSVDLATVRSSVRSDKAFYSAEAALNMRAEKIRKLFTYYDIPTGTSPSLTNPCEGGNMGSGHFACQTETFNNDTVTTYVVPSPANPAQIAIPAGEAFAGLNATESTFDAYAIARRADGTIGAQVGMRFMSRAVPIYQFAQFTNFDYEFYPGSNALINGPVYVNGNAYLTTAQTLRINGALSIGRRFYRGNKASNYCDTGGTLRIAREVPGAVFDDTKLLTLSNAVGSPYRCTGVRTNITSADFSPWNGMIRIGTPKILLPDVNVLDPLPGSELWNLADLRLVLRVNGTHAPITTNSPTGIEVRTQSNTLDVLATQKINNCTGPADTRFNGHPIAVTSSQTAPVSNQMYNSIMGVRMTLLEVDMRYLLQCLEDESILALDDSTNGGLIFHFSVSGPDSGAMNSRYAVRLRNANELRRATGSGATVKGLTIITNQQLYTVGDFNSTNKKPAALISDKHNLLSANWDDDISDGLLANRNPVNTTINAAIVDGNMPTGRMVSTDANPTAGHDILPYAAPALHENWSNGSRTITYTGSNVSLFLTRYLNLYAQNNINYSDPVRVRNFDTDFNDPEKLPPASFSFVYLKQEAFTRDFEQ